MNYADDVFVMFDTLFVTDAIYIYNNVAWISMELVIPLRSLYWSIHTKDESKRRIAFVFIFGVN